MKTLKQLGERKAIQIISKIVTKGNEEIGIGDDCAAFDLGNEYLLISTDMITEENHISKKMKPKQIGWFITAINLSDIAAKGGKPLGLVLSLGLPSNTSDSFIIDLMKGADLCAKKYNTSIVGGDTKENSNITISATIIGTVNKNEFMSRKGAKVGDILAVTGTLGDAGLGYYLLNKKVLNNKKIKSLFEPNPRIMEGLTLSKLKVINSCMDISDGLSSSLYQLLEINDVGFEINKDKIPLSNEFIRYVKNKKIKNIYDYGLHFGGDYELLFTISPNNFKILQESIKNTGIKITQIGKVIKEKEIFIIENNSKSIMPNNGYEHFKNKFF